MFDAFISQNRKLQNTIEQRDKQFKHERKKLERDLEKLKERVQALSVGKTRELPSIDISEAIGKKTGVPRATWSTETSTNKYVKPAMNTTRKAPFQHFRIASSFCWIEESWRCIPN